MSVREHIYMFSCLLEFSKFFKQVCSSLHLERRIQFVNIFVGLLGGFKIVTSVVVSLTFLGLIFQDSIQLGFSLLGHKCSNLCIFSSLAPPYHQNRGKMGADCTCCNSKCHFDWFDCLSLVSFLSSSFL